jgi:hypothetical protein
LASLAGNRDSLSDEDVLNALTHDDPSDDRLQALEALETLGTELGRDAIMSAMDDQRVPVQTLPSSAGAREFARRLFLAQRCDAMLADVFARARANS